MSSFFQILFIGHWDQTLYSLEEFTHLLWQSNLQTLTVILTGDVNINVANPVVPEQINSLVD